MPIQIPPEVILQIPADRWDDLGRILETYPNLPLAADIAILQYGKVSTDAFVARVPASWSKRVHDLAAKLNAAAVVVALQEQSLDPVLAPMAAEMARGLAGDNLLAGLWLLITVFFSEGEEAASYFFVALEAMAMARTGTTTVARLDIPAPHNFWREPDWHSPRSVMSLLLVLACPRGDIFKPMSVLSRTLGEPIPDLDRMDKEPSMSLSEQYLVAKREAEESGHTTIFGVDFMDKGLTRLKKDNPRSEKDHLSFRRMFMVGICPKGVKIWQAGGDGRSETLKEQNERQGPEMMEAEEVDQFMMDFDRLVSNGKGRWNAKSYKWYQRCFGVDLRTLQEEKDKKLLMEYETWVQLYTIWDVKKENVAKLKWM